MKRRTCRPASRSRNLYWYGQASELRNAKIGQEYFDKGIAIDAEKAMAMHVQACDRNDFMACATLGNIYAVAKRYGKAIQLLQRACDGGNLVGCGNLGYAYDTGRGVAKDEAKAVALYQKACDGGEVRGCYNLGGSYFEGHGVAKDDVKAAQLAKMACDGGDPGGCARYWDIRSKKSRRRP
ncbi:MAG TPA: tetratricopeptide repeat protein [Thermoanaerobaculia bacterium]|nr:tetratricopeptide repeat protein [Thermoanaerobaculia bacterium]